jgi:uncharacterized membrane protein YphA (DoxX/SURF4 family)
LPGIRAWRFNVSRLYPAAAEFIDHDDTPASGAFHYNSANKYQVLTSDTANHHPEGVTIMRLLIDLICWGNRFLNQLRSLDFIAPLALRLYLAPVFWIAGMNKLSDYDSTVSWFGNPDWGLGLPFPAVLAALATWTEIIGAGMLLIGFGVRWVSIPLMATMVVAMVSVHWHNGWQAIADSSSAFASGQLGPLALENTDGAAERLARAKSILQEHGNYEWLTESGSFVILNNGIEWAATYFLMLLVLFFMGAGRFFSLDHWLGKTSGDFSKPRYQE